jgi:hypothetical protein
MRAGIVVAGGGLGLVAQGVALLGLGVGWAGAYDVSRGDCGYDGTCSDAHSPAVAVLGWLVLVGLEVAVGTIAAWAGVRRAGGVGGQAEFACEWVVRVAAAALIGSAAAWGLLLQADVVDWFAVMHSSRSDAVQGRFFIGWNARVMAVESILVVLGWFAAVSMRRARAARRDESAGIR